MQRKLIKIRFQGIMLSKLSHQNTKYQVSVNKVKSKTKSMQNQQDSEKNQILSIRKCQSSGSGITWFSQECTSNYEKT